VIKGFRIEENVARLLELLAAAHGESFSDFTRRVLMKTLVEEETFLKNKLQQLRNVLLQIEKSHDEELIRRAEIAARLYPMENADLEYYVAIEKASRAAEQLVRVGFEKSFIEELCRQYFVGSGEERIVFQKSIEAFIEDVERRERLAESYRQARRTIFGSDER